MGRKKLRGIALEDRLDEVIEKLKEEIQHAKKERKLIDYLSNRTYSSRNGVIQKLLKSFKQEGKNTDNYDTQVNRIIDQAEEMAYASTVKKRIAALFTKKEKINVENDLTNYRKNKLKKTRVSGLKEYRKVGGYYKLIIQ